MFFPPAVEIGMKQCKIIKPSIFYRERHHRLYFMFNNVNVVPLCEQVIEWNRLIFLVALRFIHTDRMMTQCVTYKRKGA